MSITATPGTSPYGGRLTPRKFSFQTIGAAVAALMASESGAMRIAIHRKGGNEFTVREVPSSNFDDIEGSGSAEELVLERVGTKTFSWQANNEDLFKVASSSLVSGLNKWGAGKLTSFNDTGFMDDQATVDANSTIIIDQIANKTWLIDDVNLTAEAISYTGDVIADYSDGGDYLEG